MLFDQNSKCFFLLQFSLLFSLPFELLPLPLLFFFGKAMAAALGPSMGDVRNGPRRPFFVADLSAGKEPDALRVVNEFNFDVLPPFAYIATSRPMDALTFAPPSDNFLRLERPNVRGFEVFYANPAKKWALRTLRRVEEDTVLFEYAALLSEDSDEPAEENDDYLFTFEYQNRHFQLDAFRQGNLARFVNHSCMPNCFTRLALLLDNNANNDGGCGGDGADDDSAVPRLFICAGRQIVAGEELTLDYGDEWWRAKRTGDEGIRCQCQMTNCRFKTSAA